MRERGWAVFVAVVVAGVAAIVLWGALDSRPVRYQAGPRAVTLAARLRPGQTVCTPAFVAPIAFSRLITQLGTFRKTGPALEAVVRRGGRTLARGRLTGGYADVSSPPISLDRRVGRDIHLSVCLRNAGTRPAALYGSSGEPERDSHARTRTLKAVPALSVATGRSRSALASVPDVMRRAATFKGAFVSTALLWLVAALAVFGVPALIARAIAVAGRQDAA